MKPIRTEDDYHRAVARIDKLAVRPDTESNEELDLLTILVMAYEAEHVPDEPMDPIEYLKASMTTVASLRPTWRSSLVRAAEPPKC